MERSPTHVTFVSSDFPNQAIWTDTWECINSLRRRSNRISTVLKKLERAKCKFNSTNQYKRQRHLQEQSAYIIGYRKRKYEKAILRSTFFWVSFISKLIFSAQIQIWKENHPLKVNVLTSNFLKPNCSKFAVECDWNKDFSNTYAFLFFFQEKTVFIWKKLENFQNRSRWQICSRMRMKSSYIRKIVFHLIWDFFAEIRNCGKLSKFTEVSFRKNAFILLKGIFSRVTGRKICRQWAAVLFTKFIFNWITLKNCWKTIIW